MISLEDSFYLENVSFYTNSASPTYNRKLCERIIKLCLPVKMQICFSHRLQRLLFTLMKTMNADLQLKADVMIHLVNFLEEMDTNSDLWMCCCESGFAISFLQHLLPVVEEENQFAIGTFIKQKINELYVGIIQHENKYDMKAKFLLLQELLYMVAISNDFEWSLHAYEIVLAAKGVLSLFMPYGSPEAAGVAMKCLLVFSTVLSQILSNKTSTSLSPLDPSLVQGVVDVCTESARIVLACEQKVSAAMLNKNALVVLSKASLAVPGSANYISQHLVKFFEESFPAQTRISLKQFLLRTHNSHQNSLDSIDAIDATVCKEVQEVLDVYISLLTDSIRFENGNRHETSSDMTVGMTVAKFCMQLFAMDVNPISANSVDGAMEHNLSPAEVLQVIHDFMQRLVMTLFHDFVTLSHRGACQSFLHHLFDSILLSFDCSYGCPMPLDDIVASLQFVSLLVDYSETQVEFAASSVSLARYLEQQLQQVMCLCTSSAVMHVISKQLIRIITIKNHHHSAEGVRMLQDMTIGYIVGVESYVQKLGKLLHVGESPRGQNASAIVDNDEVNQTSNRVNGLLSGYMEANTQYMQFVEYDRAQYDFLGALFDRTIIVFIEVVQLHLYNYNQASLCCNDTVTNNLMLILCNTLCALSSINTQLFQFTVQSEEQQSALGVNLTRNVSTFRIWTYLLLLKLHYDHIVDVKDAPSTFRSTVHSSLFRILQHHIQSLSCYSLPMLFGKMISISKAKDIIDEIHSNDMFLQAGVYQQHKQYGYLSRQLRKFARFPSYGLAFHQLLYYSVLQYLEGLHVSVSMDIRHMVSYSRDLSYSVNKHRRAALLAISKNVRSLWLQSIEHYFLRIVHVQDQSLLLTSDGMNMHMKADMGHFIYCLQDVAHEDQLENLGAVDSVLEPKHWPVELVRSFLTEQSKFLVQYCVDEYEEVRSFCMETFLLLLKSQRWIVASAAPALTSLILKNVLVLEDEYHNVSNLEVVQTTGARQRYQPVMTTSDEVSSESHEEDVEQIVQYRKHPLLSPFLAVSSYLPKVIYPQNEDHIYAASLNYFQFAYTFLSIHLSHSFRANALAYFVSKTQKSDANFEGSNSSHRSIAVAIAEEMLSSYIPVYHIYQQSNDHHTSTINHLHLGFDKLDNARRKAARYVHGQYERNKQALEGLYNTTHESVLIGMQPVVSSSMLTMHTLQSKKLLALMHTTKSRDNAQASGTATPSHSSPSFENELDDLLTLIGNTAYFLSSITFEQRRLVKISDIADHVTQLAGLIALLIAKANSSRAFSRKSKGIVLSTLATYFDILEKVIVYYVQEKTLIATIVNVVDSINAQHHHQHVGQSISLLTVQLTSNVLLVLLQNARHTVYSSFVIPLIAVCQRLIDQYHNAAVYSCLIHMLTQILHALLHDKSEQRSLLNQVCGVRSKNNLVILSLLSLACKVMKYHHLATCQQDSASTSMHMVNVETVCILREYLVQAFLCFLVDISDTRDKSRVLISVEPYDIPVVVQEMNNLTYIFEEILLDIKFYPLDYPTQRFQKSSTPQSSGQQGLGSIASDVSPSINMANEPPSTNQSSLFVLFGPEAGLAYFTKLTKFRHVYKRYKEQVYTRDSYLFASDLPLLLSKSSNIVSSINDTKLLGIGVYSQNEGVLLPSDGSSKNTGRSQGLITNSAMLSSLYLYLYRYMHYLHIRYLSDHSLHHNAVNDSFSHLIEKFLCIANASKIVSSVKIYKQAIKALWLHDPLAALRLHALYPAVNAQDGRKKGVSHIASFILSLVQNHAIVSSTGVSVLSHPEILEVMYQHILYNPIVVADTKLQCVRYLQFLNDVPIHVVISMLSRHHLVHIADGSSSSRESFDICSNVAMIRYIDQILYTYTTSSDADKLVFHLPQLVQLLRRDKFGVVYKYLVFMALNSLNFCNELMYVLLTEGYNNLLPLSGKQNKKHGKQGKYGFCFQQEGVDPLPYLCLELHREVLSLLPQHTYTYLTKQLELFHTITHVSHALMSVKNKDLHKEFIYKALKDVVIPEGTFLPTNIYHKVLTIDIQSGKAMQSAAKCPFLLMFTTTKWTGPEAHVKSLGNVTTNASIKSGVFATTSHIVEPATSGTHGRANSQTDTPDTEKVIVKNRSKGIGKRVESGMFTTPKKIAGENGESLIRHETAGTKEEVIREGCIFKVNDDCRQDMLIIQVIRVMVECFARAQVDVFMAPYTVVSLRVGEERHLGGIIQVVGGGGVHSRDQLGKAGYKTLLQYFVTHYGPVGSEGFLRAQLNFAKSLAGYSILCYLLHIKDRHNGNILFDSAGHIVHIDFGFILGISPGGNLGFEASPFKLSKEMLDLLGGVKSEAFRHYMSLTIQAYLAIREVHDEILAVIVSFADADLPCFQFREDVLARLKERFVGDLSESQAAKHMENLVMKAVHDWTGAAYDGVQKLQNNIYSPEWK